MSSEKGPYKKTALEQINEFMNRQRIDVVPQKDYLDEIFQECRNGLEEKPSSMEMLNTFTSRKVVTIGSPSLKLIIDAGGTNFRIVVMKVDGAETEIISYKRHPMPGSKEKIDRDTFFNNIVDFLEPVLKKDYRIHVPSFTGFTALQFCFSYPVRNDETGEGYVVGLSKEIDIEGLIGQPLKKHLLAALWNRGYKNIQEMVILNDTTATLLAGCYAKTTSGEIGDYYSFLGIVWGTGFNIAYEENNFFPKPYIVNSEAGNYSRFPMTAFDQEIDKNSLNPGDGLAEKKISGYYFSLMVKHLLGLFFKEDNQNTIFSDGLREIIENPQIQLKSEHISQFLTDTIEADNKPEFFFRLDNKDTYQFITWEDKVNLRYFIERLSSRSAYLTALMVIGLMLLTQGQGTDPQKNSERKKFCLVLDGSMIRNMPGLKDKFIQQLTSLCQPYNFDFDILELDRAPIIGTAIAKYNFD